MSATTLRPSGAGTLTELSKNTGSPNWANVSEYIADNDTSYVYILSDGNYVDNYAVDYTVIPENIVIDSVEVFAVISTATVSYGTNNLLFGGNQSPDIGLGNNAAYTLVSYEWTTDPSTSLPWTRANLITKNPGINLSFAKCTQLYMVVNYHTSTGFSPNGYLFNSTGSDNLYITDGSQTGLDLNSDFTIEALVIFHSQPGGDDRWAILGKGETGTLAYALDYLNDGSAYNKLVIEISDNGSRDRNVFYTDITFETDVLYHIAISCDLSASAYSKFRFYINGNYWGQGSTWLDDPQPSVTSIYNSSDAFTLGTNAYYYTDMTIKDIRIWNDIRTDFEINANKFNQLVGNETNLVAYWKLEEDYLDSTSNNNDLIGDEGFSPSAITNFPLNSIETIMPNGAGDSTELTEWDPLVPNWATVGDLTKAGLWEPFTYGDSDALDLYTVDSCNIPNTAVINSVSVYVVCWGDASGTPGDITPYIKENSTLTAGTTEAFTGQTMTNGGDTWTNWEVFHNTWTTKPSNSQAWTIADVNAMQIGAAMNLSSVGDTALTWVYALVDYSVPDAVQSITAKSFILDGILQIQNMTTKGSVLKTFTAGTISAKASIGPSAPFIAEVADTVRTITSKVEIQWDGLSWTDETTYFISGKGNEEMAGPTGEGVAATLDVELDNTTGRFTPGNTSSPIYAYLKPRVPIRISIIMAGYTYRLFTGYVKNIHPNIKSAICSLECYDNQVKVSNKSTNGVVYENKRSDELLTTLCGLIGMDPSEFDFDIGTHVVNYGYFENRNVWPIMGELAVAERGRIFFDRNGVLTFWNRERLHNRNVSLVTLTRDHWITDLDYSVAEHQVKNYITVQSTPRSSSGIQTVWTNGNVEYLNPYTDVLVYVPAGQSQSAYLELEDPCTAFITPVATTDYTANNAQDGTGDDLTANVEITEFIDYGNAVFVTVTNNGAEDLYLTKFQVRGNPAKIQKWIRVIESDSLSISTYGKQTIEIQNNFIQDDASAESIAYEELTRRADAINNFKVKIIGIPYLVCGDAISVEYLPGTFERYMINTIDWTLDSAGFNEEFGMINLYLFPYTQTITAKARITTVPEKTITAKGSVDKGGAKISALAEIVFNIKAMWMADDGSGTTIADTSPTASYPLTISGSGLSWDAENPPGDATSCIDQTGGSNTGKATNASFPSNLQKFTVQFKYKPHVLSDWISVLGKCRENSSLGDQGWMIRTAGNTVAFSATQTGATSSIQNIQATLTNGTEAWTDIAITWEGGSVHRVQIYLDGYLIEEDTTTFSGDYYPCTTSDFMIGMQYQNGAYTRPMNGKLAGIVVYDYIRTAAQILREAA